LLRDELRHFPMKILVMWSGARHRSATLLWTVESAGWTYLRLFVVADVAKKGRSIIKSSV
jgi:hypothetical protein